MAKKLTGINPRSVTWICHDCAVEHAEVIPGHCATFHEGDRCGVCDEYKWTTEPRDYRWPRTQSGGGK